MGVGKVTDLRCDTRFEMNRFTRSLWHLSGLVVLRKVAIVNWRERRARTRGRLRDRQAVYLAELNARV